MSPGVSREGRKLYVPPGSAYEGRKLYTSRGYMQEPEFRSCRNFFITKAARMAASRQVTG